MRSIVLISILALFLGCAAYRTEVVSVTEFYPPTVEVELLLEPPKRSYKTFALLEDPYGGAPEEINARLTEAGRMLGADAVLITDVQNETSTEWVPAGSYYYGRRWGGMRYEPVQYRYRNVRAKALKYSAPP
ncbi:MAG TPA: hypothetical protein VJS66_01060 [Burkholderiales bacterium]|nr:hypothetical protein [Burkholderiales bacterium]